MNCFQRVQSWVGLYHEPAAVIPAVVPAPVLVGGAISPVAAWSITQSSKPRPLSNGSFQFQQAPTASLAWDSYVEVPLPAGLNGSETFTLTFTITGADPVFVHDSPNNTTDGPTTLRLLLHRRGDNMSGLGAFEFYRFFSANEFDVQLALGQRTISVPLAPHNWISVFGKRGDATPDFAAALANIGSVGFVLGGGNFAGHGVAVSTGSASLQIDAATIQ